MSIPTPKFEIGQVVYHGLTHESSERLICPDCLGSEKWTLTTPAGESFQVACQRCTYSHSSNLPSLWQRQWTVTAKRLTIGQIRIETPTSGYGDVEPVNYMCVETGVGAGSVYRESMLCATEEEALERATFEANKLTAEWRAKPEPVRHVELAKLRFRDAFSEDQASAVWQCAYHFNQLRGKVHDLMKDHDFEASEEQKDTLRDALESMEWHLDGRNNPLTALVQAAREVVKANSHESLTKALEVFAFIPDKTVTPELADTL